MSAAKVTGQVVEIANREKHAERASEKASGVGRWQLK